MASTAFFALFLAERRPYRCAQKLASTSIRSGTRSSFLSFLVNDDNLPARRSQGPFEVLRAETFFMLSRPKQRLGCLPRANRAVSADERSSRAPPALDLRGIVFCKRLQLAGLGSP